MFYFAYGSNLSPTQMASRCPGSRCLGAGRLHDWEFLISTTGTANIRRRRGRQCEGGIWRVTPFHIALLDQWEGVRDGVYRRAILPIVLDNGALVPAVTYIGVRNHPGVASPRYMLSAVLPGAAYFGLSTKHVAHLHSFLPKRPIGAHAPRYVGRRSR